jgi:apolipoprotein N-acyltransferase
VFLAGAGGTATALAFLDFDLWPLAWVAYAPILVAMLRAGTVGETILAGAAAGLATNVPAFYWLVGTIETFGGFPRVVAWAAYGLLSAYGSLQFVLLALAVRRTGLGPCALAPAIVWVALEWWYPNLFPWRLANSQRDVLTLLQLGELAGPLALSFLLVWWNGVLARTWLEGLAAARKELAAAAGSIVVAVAWGSIRIAQVDALVREAPSVRVGIVQGNLSLREKGDLRFFETNVATYRDHTRRIASSSDVVIWPETVVTEAIPRSLGQLPDAARVMLGSNRPLLTGALTYDGPPESPRFYNSVILVDEAGRIRGISDKQILMPFGEYMPLASRFPWLRNLSPLTGDFRAGTRVVVLDVPGVGRFAPLNCYEDLSARIARTAAADAEVLFSVANDAWFGDTVAPYQHEALALWRAVENRRFLVRVTNTGVTDVIEPTGRVALRLPVFEPATVVARVARLRVKTFYQRFGEPIVHLVTLAALLLLIRSRRGSGPPVHGGGGPSPATVIAAIRRVGQAVADRSSRSLPTTSTSSSMRRRFPAIVTPSTGKANSPFSIHKPEAPRE